MVRVAVLALGLVLDLACGAPARRGPLASRGGSDVEVTLYRDHAVVAHRIDVVIPPAATATVRLQVAAGVDPSNVYVVDKSELTVRGVRGVSVTPAVPAPPDAAEEPIVEDEDESAPPKPVEPPAPAEPLVPTELEIELAGPHEGHFTIAIGYDTQRITWDAAYTMTTTAARDRAVLRGAVAIRNATGLALRGASVWVVDAEHGPATLRIAERLGGDLVAREGGGSTPLAVPRELGRVDLVEGDTRVELLGPAGSSRPMKSVLVYDPIGTALDHPGVTPVRDATLGVQPPASPRVTESFEIERDPALVKRMSLPSGPVRLLDRRSDGSLALLGEARIFDASTRVADVDTIAIGTAEGVTGKRERRELTIDEDRKRLVEEFVITIENERDRPVEVLLREHFYRGLNWALAYQSIPLEHATKEGAQQVTMRIVAPPKTHKPGRIRVLYVAVYTWS